MTEALKATSDRKVRFHKSQANSFGLMPGRNGTCPCATTEPGGCSFLKPGRKTTTCYVDGLLHVYKGVRGVLEHNTNLLQAQNGNIKAMTQILDNEFKAFKAKEIKHAARNSTQPQLFYRLHWSGDVFSREYAQAIHDAVQQNSDINFWCYTRSFFAVPYLINLPNLILFLSLDPVNVVPGLVVYEEYGGPQNSNLRICYMNDVNDFNERKYKAMELLDGRNEIRKMLNTSVPSTNWLKDMELRVCPVDAGQMALEKGCPDCTRCLSKTLDT